MWYVIFVLMLIVILIVNGVRENYEEVEYDNQKETGLKSSEYISILGKVHAKFIEKLEKNDKLPFRGTCNDILNKKIQSESINESIKQNSLENCNEYASRVCQEVNPAIMMISNKYAKIGCVEINPPKSLNEKCYKNLLNCCKESNKI
jgi:hypothetical protein